MYLADVYQMLKYNVPISMCTFDSSTNSVCGTYQVCCFLGKLDGLVWGQEQLYEHIHSGRLAPFHVEHLHIKYTCPN